MTLKEYLTYDRTKDILNEMYFDNFKFWQREQRLGVINSRQSVKELAIRDNKKLKRNPYEPAGAYLDENAKEDWIKEMDNPIVLESEIPNAKSNQLIEHKRNIENTINNVFPMFKNNEVSYVSKDELQSMLDEHLTKVQNIIDEHKEEILASKEENNKSLKESLKETSKTFKETLQNKMKSKLSATKETIASVRNAGMNKLKNGIIKINETLKDITRSIDSKFNEQDKQNEKDGFYWYQSNETEINIDKIPENVAFIDRSKKEINGDIIAYKEPLTDKELNDHQLEPFNKEKEVEKTNEKKKQNVKQYDVGMEI